MVQTEEVSMDVAMSVHEGCRAWNLSSILETNLENEGITEFFEIQTKAIPQLLDCIVLAYFDSLKVIVVELQEILLLVPQQEVGKHWYVFSELVCNF